MQNNEYKNLDSEDFFGRFLASYEKLQRKQKTELKKHLTLMGVSGGTLHGWLTRKEVPLNQRNNLVQAFLAIGITL